MKSGPELRIAVIGGGWFGCHMAAQIKQSDTTARVVIFEKNENIFSKVSGNSGVRLHNGGANYPRLSQTRMTCHVTFPEFLKCYPDLGQDHILSEHVNGIRNSTNQPPKVCKEKFRALCQKFGNSVEVDPKVRNYGNILDIHEPNLILRHRLRQFFIQHLKELGVEVRLNFAVKTVKKCPSDTSSIEIRRNSETHHFDHVIFQSSHLQNPIGGQVRYHVITAMDSLGSIPE